MRNYLNKNFVLTADIDLSGYKNWTPIGAYEEAAIDESGHTTSGFSGSFDGNSHTVSNLTATNEELVGVGLFGMTSVEGIVKNLTVENATVTGYLATGGIIGYNFASVENLTLKGANTISGVNCTGGILGGHGYGTVKHCTVKDVTIRVLGDNDFSSGRIIQCDVAECGGLVVGGAFTGSIENCSAKGEIIAEGNEPVGLGGIGGCLEYMESITGCTADVSITSPNSAHAVGGLCGYAGTGDTENPAVIKDCSVKFVMNTANATHIGGLVGTGLYYMGVETVFSISNCSAEGEINGAVTPGTIAGRAENCTIADCTSDVLIDGVRGTAEIGTTDRMYESADQFAGGSGTAEDPWQVATAAQLDGVRNYLNKHFILTADIDLSGYQNWEPLGTFQPLSDKPEDGETPNPALAFSGNFNGNGHTISNVTINKYVAAGLFGCVIGAEDKPISIHDLTVKNVDVTGNFLAGGVVGYQSWNCTLENVNLTGSNKVRSNFAAGGITGATMSDLKNCSAAADIVVLNNGGYCAGVLVGGTGEVSLTDCTVTGTVTAEGDNCFGLGGLSGGPSKAVKVTNCHAKVSITALGKNNLLVGGLLGFTGTKGEAPPTLVTGCSADATITVSDSSARVGGLVGGSFYHELYAFESPVPFSYAIKNCSTLGSITGGSEATGSIAGYAYRSTVENCTSTMTINGKSENLPQIGKIPMATPVLLADSIGNTAGYSVDLTFSDDTAWRTAITGIKVDGAALTTGQFTVTEGKINIAGSVLTTAADHIILIKATGYIDAVVTQTMTAASGGDGSSGGGSSGGGSGGGISSGNTAAGTMNPETVTPGGDNTQYNKTAFEALAKATTQQTQNAQLPANAPALDPAATASVTLTTNDGIQIIVPSGAVNNHQDQVQIAVTIGTITTPPKAEHTAIVLDPLRYERQFSIAGQAEGSVQFNSPVMIRFPIATGDLPAGIKPQQLAIYRWHTDRNDWVKLGGAFDPATKTISVPTYHFSTYAVMADTGSLPNRIFGADRFATANAVAEQGWKAGADNVVLAYAYAFPDALAAGPLAFKLNAPILLTDAAELTPATLAEIQKLAPKKITLIGGTAVISQSIQDTLSATYGQANVVRYAGEDLYSTAVAIANALGTTGKAVLANGENGHYTDALAVSGYAAANGIPILFSETSALPNMTGQALSDLKVGTTIVVGGEGAISAPVYNQLTGAVRYGGSDCYETAATIATGLQLNVNRVYIVTGLNFTDALVAGNLAAHTLSPLLMVDQEVPEATSAFLKANKAAISSLIEIGGEGIINANQDQTLRSNLQ